MHVASGSTSVSHCSCSVLVPVVPKRLRVSAADVASSGGSGQRRAEAPASMHAPTGVSSIGGPPSPLMDVAKYLGAKGAAGGLGVCPSAATSPANSTAARNKRGVGFTAPLERGPPGAKTRHMTACLREPRAECAISALLERQRRPVAREHVPEQRARSPDCSGATARGREPPTARVPRERQCLPRQTARSTRPVRGRRASGGRANAAARGTARLAQMRSFPSASARQRNTHGPGAGGGV